MFVFPLRFSCLFPHLQLLCERTKRHEGGFLEPRSAGHLCHSCARCPGGARSSYILPVFGFQGPCTETALTYPDPQGSSEVCCCCQCRAETLLLARATAAAASTSRHSAKGQRRPAQQPKPDLFHLFHLFLLFPTTPRRSWPRRCLARRFGWAKPARRMAGEPPSSPTPTWPASCEWWRGTQEGCCCCASLRCHPRLVSGRWLDKLGLAARQGIDVVMRQVFFGAGSYHLVDASFEPLPVRRQ